MTAVFWLNVGTCVTGLTSITISVRSILRTKRTTREIREGASQWKPATDDNEYLPWRFVTKATIEDQHGIGTL